MIIWIASYPKSGNTWVRSIISSLIYSADGNFDFDLLQKIKQFPSKKHFENFTNDFQNINEIKKYWIESQNLINLDKEVKFFKTHHINCKIGEHAFTNKSNTLGTIYVVRDPRNLINSFTNHYSIDKNTAKNFIISRQSVTGALGEMKKDNKIFTILGSWNDHVKSWTNMNQNLLLIKYEDLIKNPLNEINKIIKFLANLIDFSYNEEKINNIINSTSFEVMKKKETEKGFHESVMDNSGENKVNFFNLGKENKWEKYLNSEDQEFIKEKLGLEMKELGYI
jgi:hypothetical protein